MARRAAPKISATKGIEIKEKMKQKKITAAHCKKKLIKKLSKREKERRKKKKDTSAF